MVLKRSRNIDSLLARKLGEGSNPWTQNRGKQKKGKEFDWEQLNLFNSEWLGGNREMNIPKTYQNIIDALGYGDDKPMYDTEGEFEGKEIAEMNAVLADPESSPPIQKIGSLLSAEGESPLDQAGREYMESQAEDRWYKEYEKNRNLTPDSAYDRNLDIQNEGDINEGTWDSVARDELAIDIASQDKARLDKILQGKEASMADFKGEEEGEESWWKGLFSSDDSGRDKSLEQEKKDNEELSGKIGAAAKLFSLLQPEQQQAAPTIPTARITRGSVAFPGMKLASQKERRKYFTPKGLMA